MAESEIILIIFTVLNGKTTRFSIRRPQLCHIRTVDLRHQLHDVDAKEFSQAIHHHARHIDFVHHAAQILNQLSITYLVMFKFIGQRGQHKRSFFCFIEGDGHIVEDGISRHHNGMNKAIDALLLSVIAHAS
ncbi:Uncharacterised protein [Klebsiella pneumoniae]|nr:Uncharacterised protein [Klebsiella pneumoniae]